MGSKLSGIGRFLLISALLVGLVAMLIAYPTIVGVSLPSVVYTRPQQAFLETNLSRELRQAPAELDFQGAMGMPDSATSADGIMASQPGILTENRVQATLEARYEEQSGVSVTVYDLTFRSEYRLEPRDIPTTVALTFPFPANLDTLHDVSLLVSGREPDGVIYTTQHILWGATLEPGRTYDIVVAYRAEGVNSFEYGLYKDRRLGELEVTVDVTGLRGSEVLDTSLPPTASDAKLQGDSFTWDYTNLVANRDIQLKLPQRLSFSQRVAALQDDFLTLGLLAPLWVGIFLASMAGLFWLEGIHLRLEVYLLAGLGLVLFYPLLTFMSGMIELTVGAIFAFLTIFVVEVVFFGLTLGWRRAGWRIAWLLLIVLGLFSLGVLTPWKGLLLTLGGILLVESFMLAYARRPKEETPEPEVVAAEEVIVTEVEYAPVGSPHIDEFEQPEAPASPEEEVFTRHCLHCGRDLGDDYRFCASCGYDLQALRRCANCGYEQVIVEGVQPTYCLRCGETLT